MNWPKIIIIAYLLGFLFHFGAGLIPQTIKVYGLAYNEVTGANDIPVPPKNVRLTKTIGYPAYFGNDGAFLFYHSDKLWLNVLIWHSVALGLVILLARNKNWHTSNTPEKTLINSINSLVVLVVITLFVKWFIGFFFF